MHAIVDYIKDGNKGKAKMNVEIGESRESIEDRLSKKIVGAKLRGKAPIHANKEEMIKEGLENGKLSIGRDEKLKATRNCNGR